MAEPKTKCVEPAGGPIAPPSQTKPTEGSAARAEEVTRKVVPLVGNPAPDFEANAYQSGGFRNVKLSDFRGKWVVLCFYPGDFTFV